MQIFFMNIVRFFLVFPLRNFKTDSRNIDNSISRIITLNLNYFSLFCHFIWWFEISFVNLLMSLGSAIRRSVSDHAPRGMFYSSLIE